MFKELVHKADLGNGYYMNPILDGDYADPAVFREGEDYYCLLYTSTYDGEAQEKEAAPKIYLHGADIETETVTYRESEPVWRDKVTVTAWTMDDVRSGKASLEEFTAQLTVRELAEICVGSARGGQGTDTVIGSASALVPGAAGDTTSLLLEDRNVKNMILADGPAGLRLNPHFATRCV